MAMAVLERIPDTPWCRPQRPGRRGACCVPVAKPPERPDPAIYSQDQQIQAGQSPSWDTPDILTNPDVPWTLHLATQAPVRYLSPHLAAADAPVQGLGSTFGIGL